MSRYIDADMLEKDGWTIQRIRQVSSTEMVYETKKPTDFPAADVAEVVRCNDCVHRDPEDKRCDCGGHEWIIGKVLPVEDEWFCADGKKMDEVEE